jgi:hypothetical protein
MAKFRELAPPGQVLPEWLQLFERAFAAELVSCVRACVRVCVRASVDVWLEVALPAQTAAARSLLSGLSHVLCTLHALHAA